MIGNHSSFSIRREGSIIDGQRTEKEKYEVTDQQIVGGFLQANVSEQEDKGRAQNSISNCIIIPEPFDNSYFIAYY